MKNYIYIISSCLFAGMMASCQSDNLAGEQGEGYIQLSSVSIDKSVQSRAGETPVMSVDINNADGTTFKHAEDWTTLQGESFLVKAGTTYTVKAYSANSTLAEGFEASPYYEGATDVTVKANQAQVVEVTCGLAQSMVTVSYSDTFKKYFTNYSSVVTGEEGGTTKITFAGTETRAAYVKANQPLNIAVILTPKGKTETTLTQQIVALAAPAYRYNVKYDVDVKGTGSIDVTVDQNRHEYEITLGVPMTPQDIVTTDINGEYDKVWGKFAYLNGTYKKEVGANKVQFMYKKSTDETWTTIDATQVGEAEVDGTKTYENKITGLEFGTDYVYKIICGEEQGNEVTFTTEAYQEVPNLNFDTWTQSGKNWFANAVANDYDGEGAYWATGNEGVTSFLAGNKDPITIPVEGEDAYSGKAAKMTSITGVTLVGAAAGNLFIGKYKTNMSKPSASVTFGRPYTGARPTKLSGYYKYTSCAIDHNAGTGIPGTLVNDECNIYLKIWDEAGNEIGFGEFVGKESVSTYTKFEFNITYSNPSAKPATMTIVATSSHYGGEFEGAKVVGQVGAGSTLWVDEFELSYD